MKAKVKLIRVEMLGGPLDGKWITVAVWQERFLFPASGVTGILHDYRIDEIYEGSTVRRVFRHSGVVRAQGACDL